MSVLDQGFLLAETRTRPMHVGSLQLFEPRSDVDADEVAHIYQEALEYTDIHPRLARRPRRGPSTGGLFVWEHVDDIDLGYHFRHSALPRPGTIKELLVLVSRLHAQLLDRSRPLWEAHLIEGLSDGRFAIYTKVHHSLVDGISGMRMIQKALSPDPEERGMPPFHAATPSARRKRGGGGIPNPVSLVRSTVGGTTSLVTQTAQAGFSALRDGLTTDGTVMPVGAPTTILNRKIGAARRFAADSWPVARIAAVQDATGATMNDVVTAVCGGALRAYLLEEDSLPEHPLVAFVPLSLRDDSDGDGDSGNKLGLILANLATHLPDAGDRFALTRASLDEAKARMKGIGQAAAMAMGAPSILPLLAAPYVPTQAGVRGFNLVISNVPGPHEPLYWNGNRMTDIYPVSIVSDDMALNITLTSYAGNLGFGYIGDRDAVPHLQRLLVHTENALVDLEKAVGVA
ncbi:WS/DGAT/MGAT family O-acyltransferase [Rhodococcus aerolatus]